MKCLHMSIKISGRFEMQPKWNFMWTELIFHAGLEFQTGMSSLRLSCERTLRLRTSVTKILRYFRINGCRKWRNRFQKKKFVVLAKYFEQQTDCSRCKRNISQSRRSPLWRNHLYFLSNKWKPCHWAKNSWPHNLRTALEKYIRFQWNLQTTGWRSKEQYNKLWDLFPNFFWNYTYNFENTLTVWS